MPRVTVDIETSRGKIPLQEALKDPRPILESAARKLVALIKLGFKTSTAPDGSKWLPLKLRTGQPLRDRGLLVNSITTQRGADFIDIGTSRVGARVHQFGATIVPVRAKMLRFFAKGSKVPIFRKSVTIPARPFFPLDAGGNMQLPGAWQKSFLDVVRQRLEGKTGGSE